MRLFRVDRVDGVERPADAPAPRPDVAALTVSDYYEYVRAGASKTTLDVDLTPVGVRRLEHMDGLRTASAEGGHLTAEIETGDIQLFARMFLGMGTDALVCGPEELVARMKDILRQQVARYGV